MGLDPRPYTLRELFWLFEGRDRQQWIYTAHLMANQRACAGDKNPNPVKHHPYMQDNRLKNLRLKALELKARKEKDNAKNTGKD